MCSISSANLFRNFKIRDSRDPLPEEPFEEIDVWGKKIAANVVRLRLIGTHDTSDRCIVLRDAINNPELRKTIRELDVVERTTVSTQLHGKETERQSRQQLSASSASVCSYSVRAQDERRYALRRHIYTPR
jgi:hypothetical protein